MTYIKTDIFGDAITDYYHGKNAIIKTHSSVGGYDELPVQYLFRTFDEMPAIEQVALKMSYGRVLDLGCGAGSHALHLQNQGLFVKAVDISEGAINVCRLRGIKQAQSINIWDLQDKPYDTILALMNGTGLCGSLQRIPAFLQHLKSLLSPKGQILIDSSDIIYMFEDEDGEIDVSDLQHYYGEVEFQTKYLDRESSTFPWLYIDFNTLQQEAIQMNLNCELVQKGSHYDYLARLSFPA